MRYRISVALVAALRYRISAALITVCTMDMVSAKIARRYRKGVALIK